MKPEDAEEYTLALGQVVAGGWRQIALGQRLGVPKALGLSVDAWVKQRLGGYVKLSVEETRAAAVELKAQGHSQRQIKDALGVGKGTVSRALGAPNGASTPEKPNKVLGVGAPNGATEPLDVIAGISTTEEAKAAQKIRAARERREQQREEQRRENAAKVAGVSDPRELLKIGRFATITIDPPWDFSDEGDVNHFGRGKHNYASKSIDELLTFPVAELADTDCHLYLWITNRSLPKGFRLIDAWGFRYITCLTWVKPSFGIGNYFRGQTEQILFAVKGSQPLKRNDVGTVLEAHRGNGHSTKPDEFYALVESCSPAPYLEFFQRIQRPGWTGWGENTLVSND